MLANKILVVDDDHDIGFMIQTMLQYHGYDVMVTDKADQTLTILKQNQFNLIIMDMLMSGINGTDICTSIKQDVSKNDMGVLMISAHPFAKELCLQVGADEFVSKPFDMEDMLTKIKKFATPSQQ